jgi:hypothetical protein
MSRYAAYGPPVCDYVIDPGFVGQLSQDCGCKLLFRDILPPGETDMDYAKRVYSPRCADHMDMIAQAEFDAACEAAAKGA